MTFIADLWGANKQAKAAKDAANVQAQSAKDANAIQLQMFNQSRSDAEPWRQAGMAGLNEYMALLGLPTQGSYGQPSYGMGGQGQYGQPQYGQQGGGLSGMFGDPQLDRMLGESRISNDGPAMGYLGHNGLNTGSLGTMQPLALNGTASNPSGPSTQAGAFDRFRANPGYQFGLDEGMKSVQASAAARGGLNSGAALKSLFKFGNDYADQQGFTPYMNRLASLSGVGQTQTQNNATLGQNYANQAGANLTNAGQARARGIYDSTNAWTNGVGNAIGTINRNAASFFGGGF